MQGSQSYIHFYNSLLSNPGCSQQANQQLMRIEMSDSSWLIAKDLVHNKQYHLHGCQLLSKKLNRPYSEEMEKKYQIGAFIMGLTQLNKVLYFCLAKLALQLNWQKIELKSPHNITKSVLNVLKEVPEAAYVVQIGCRNDQREKANRLYLNYKGFLIETFTTDTQLVLECLQNFTQNGYKLESEQLFRLLLTQPLAITCQAMQNILLHEHYEALNNDIYHYLIKKKSSSSTQQYFTVLLAFSCSLQLLNLSPDVLTDILSKILQIISIENTLNQQQRKNVSYISDSFHFWSLLREKLTIERGSVEKGLQIKICLDAFAQLWKIVIQRSIQYDMPKFQQGETDNLAISLDQQDDLSLDEEMEICINSNKFRNTAEDLLAICYRALNQSKQHESRALSCLFQLSKSQNCLHLELSIFVMSCVVEQGCHCIQEINSIFEEVIGNKNAKNPYIWQQLIKLLGKFGLETVCDGRIFRNVLIILKQSIQIKELAVLACQSLNEIIHTCNSSIERKNQICLIQELVDYLYVNFYFKTNDMKIFNTLTKLIVNFIYYMRPEIGYFQIYLKALNQKIQCFNNVEDKCQIVENLVICHISVMQQNSAMFTICISQFLVAFMPILVDSIQKCSGKRMSTFFRQFGTILAVGGGYHTEIWVEGLLLLFNNQKVREQKGSIISIFNKIMDVEKYDQHYKASISKLIMSVESFVSESLVQSSMDSIKLITNCLNFHFKILNLHIEVVSNYNPDAVLAYIVGKVYKNHLRFEYESSKISLAIVRNVISKNYRVEQLLEETLKVYSRIVGILWKSLEAILYEAFKVGGGKVYENVFAKIKPTFLPPNAFFNNLMVALQQSNGKDIKNILTQLT